MTWDSAVLCHTWGKKQVCNTNRKMTVQEFYPTFLKYPAICTDSREAKPGSIFFALKGDNFDGNKFALESLEKGCGHAVVDGSGFISDDRLTQVSNVLDFLQDLASYHRSLLDIPVIGLTGSNGKTTTKELIAAVLSRKFNAVYTKGNLNNHIGVPLTLLSADLDTEILIVEMGANHIGEIAQLCRIAQPTHGLITNIGHAHLEGFGSYEGVIKAKTELYKYLISRKGIVFLNQSDLVLKDQIGSEPFIPYGIGQLPTPSIQKKKGFFLSFDLNLEPAGNNETISIATKLVGDYNLPNALAALTIGNYFGISWQDCGDAISSFKPGMNRSEFRETNHNKLILDAYNANPDSLKEAIKVFSELEEVNKLAILGGMRELGQYSHKSHQMVLEDLNSKGIESILIGEEFRIHAEEQSFVWYPDINALIEEIRMNPILGKTILLKGSRGNQLEKLLPFL